MFAERQKQTIRSLCLKTCKHCLSLLFFADFMHADVLAELTVAASCVSATINANGKNGPSRSPRAVCADATDARAFYFSDRETIRHVKDGVVSLAADASARPNRKPAPSLGVPAGLLCSSDGRTLYYTDSRRHQIRAIDLHTRTVDGKHYAASTRVTETQSDPRALVFDPNTAIPNSVIYFTAMASVFRLELPLGTLCSFCTFSHVSSRHLALPFLDSDVEKLMQVFEARGALQQNWLLAPLWRLIAAYLTRPLNLAVVYTGYRFDPHGIVMTPSGNLICSCIYSHSICMIETHTQKASRIAGCNTCGPPEGSTPFGW